MKPTMSQRSVASQEAKRDVERVTAQLLEDARTGGFGHNRMEREDAMVIASVLRDYHFRRGRAGPQD